MLATAKELQPFTVVSALAGFLIQDRGYIDTNGDLIIPFTPFCFVHGEWPENEEGVRWIRGWHNHTPEAEALRAAHALVSR